MLFKNMGGIDYGELQQHKSLPLSQRHLSEQGKMLCMRG